MSQFLAPIHKLMYQKIHFLDDLTTSIAMPHLLEKADETLGKVERGELSLVIDHDNIHAWLNRQVVLTEKRLAFIVEGALEEGGSLDSLLNAIYALGENESFSGNAKEAFMAINGSFLDGMPCDMVLRPTVTEEECMEWEITKDVHSEYWTDKLLYNKLRDAWVEGLVKKSGYEYKREGNKVSLKRKDSK